MSALDGRCRARAARCATVLFLFLSACSEPSPPPAPRAREADVPPAASCTLGEPITLRGSAPALTDGALVLRTSEGLRLVSLEGDARAPIPIEAESVPRAGLVAHGEGWLALAATAAGPSLLVIERGATRAIPLASGALVDGALVVRGDRAIAAWIDEARALEVTSVDLLRDRVDAPVRVASVERGAPLLAATRRAAVVSWTAHDAELVPVDGASARAPAPGLPLALLAMRDAVAVLHRASDRTGLWLAAPGAPAVRVTHPDAHPETPAAAALPDGAVIAYRSGPDLFVQRIGSDGVPQRDPIVAGSAAPDARREGPSLASRDHRLWIAWEAESAEAPVVIVRAGECPE